MTIYVDGQRIYEVNWKGDKMSIQAKLRQWCKDNDCAMSGVRLWCGEWIKAF